MKNRNEGSPYNVLDGKWGGFGMTYWYNGVDTEHPENVFEINKFPKRGWGRVWDNDLGVWREPTEYEKLMEIVIKPIPVVVGGIEPDADYNMIVGKRKE